jgi:ABC-type glycerol-3-phosphate transport system substrate-binding protein
MTRQGVSGGYTRRSVLKTAAAAGATLFFPAVATSSRRSGALRRSTVTIRHIVAQNPAMVPAYNQVITAFQKANPGVSVQLDLSPFEEAVTKVLAGAAAGQPYDVIDAGSDENQWQLLSKGLFEPITDVVEGLGARNYFIPNLINKYHGEYWMAPYLIIPLHIEYRKDLFEAKGIHAPLETWDELLAAAQALTDTSNRKYGLVMPLMDQYFYGYLQASMLLGDGGHFINAQGKVVFDSPPTFQLLNFCKELLPYCVPNAIALGAPDMQNLFYKEVAAMTWYSDLQVVPNTKSLNPSLAGKIGIMPIPPRTKNQQPVVRTTGQYYSVGKGSANVAVAKEYIRWLLHPDNEATIIASVPLDNVPAVTSVIHSPKLWSYPSIAANKQLYLDYINIAAKYGRELAIEENPGVFNPKTGAIMDAGIFIECLEQVLVSGVAPEKAVATATAKMKAIVA